jgi:hypothetical protein
MRMHFTALCAALPLLASCGDSPTSTRPIDPVRIEITGDSVLVAGTSVTFQVRAYDAGGASAPAAATWSLLDPHYAELVGSGRVTGSRPGVTALVAAVGALADTAWFRVRWPDLAQGETRGTILGTDTVDFRWTEGLSKVYDALGSEVGDESFLVLGRDAVGAGADTTVMVRLPSILRVGTEVIAPYPLGQGQPTQPGVILTIETETSSRVYYGLGGTLEVSEAAYPARPGHTTGQARATLTFRATRYTVGAGGQPLPTSDTVSVSLETFVQLQHLARPTVEVSIQGGPATGLSVRTHAETDDDGRGGRLVWWDIDLDGVPGGFPWEASQEIRLRTFAPGTYALGTLTPGTYSDSASWPDAFSAMYYRDHPLVGLSSGGSVEITRWIPATDAFYSEIHGTVATVLRLWDEAGNDTGTTVDVVVTFAVPGRPGAGLPN